MKILSIGLLLFTTPALAQSYIRADRYPDEIQRQFAIKALATMNRQAEFDLLGLTGNGIKACTDKCVPLQPRTILFVTIKDSIAHVSLFDKIKHRDVTVRLEPATGIVPAYAFERRVLSYSDNSIWNKFVNDVKTNPNSILASPDDLRYMKSILSQIK